jgi:hypothetical protein
MKKTGGQKSRDTVPFMNIFVRTNKKFYLSAIIVSTIVKKGFKNTVRSLLLGPHRRTPKPRVRPGNRGFAPPHLLYKLGGFGPGFRVQVGV